MFTRSKNQNYPNRAQTMNSTNHQQSGNNTYNQHGKYEPNIFKSSGISINASSKPSVTMTLQQTTQNPQQAQQQQQQQHQQQGQQQEQPPNTQMNQGQNQPVNQQPRLKPILKQSIPITSQNNPTPSTISTVESFQSEHNLTSMESEDYESVKQEEVSSEKDVPKWKRTKIPGNKVNRKLKRLRMNQRLRKILMPKNAIMVLNEMKAGVQFSLPENHSMPNSMFLVHAQLNGKTYVGQGMSKLLARQNAAENALKSLLSEKMTAAAMKVKIDEEQESNQPIKDSESDISSLGLNDTDKSDDIPWSLFASFALYKLFLECQNQGTVVPLSRPGVQQPIKAKPEPTLPVEKKLPPNATSIHPVMLLNQMRPGTTYVEVNRVGDPPNTLFTLSVEIDGKVYSGEAKNKKDAKKMAAKSALEALFSLNYLVDNNGESNSLPQPMEINNQLH